MGGFFSDLFSKGWEGTKWLFDSSPLKPISDYLRQQEDDTLLGAIPGYTGAKALTGTLSGLGGLVGASLDKPPETPIWEIPNIREILQAEAKEGLPTALETVAPIDIATLGLSGAASALPKGMKGVSALAKAAKAADVSEGLYGVENIGEGLYTGDPTKVGVGFARAAGGMGALLGGRPAKSTFSVEEPTVPFAPVEEVVPTVSKEGFDIAAAPEAAPKEVDLEALMAPEKAKIAAGEDYNTRYMNMTESFVRRIKDEAARVLGNENIKDVDIKFSREMTGPSTASFVRELNTMYLNPDLLHELEAKDILHELAHTNVPHSTRTLDQSSVSDLPGNYSGFVPISPETVAEVSPDLVPHTWENIQEVGKISPIEHEFRTNQDILWHNPDILKVAEEFNAYSKKLLADKNRAKYNLSPLKYDPATGKNVFPSEAAPSANDPVVQFVDAKRAKYGNKWSEKLDTSELETYNKLLKGEEVAPEGEFTAVEDVGKQLESPEKVETPTEAPKEAPKEQTPLEAARVAVTAEGPKVKWRVTFNDGNTVSVEAADRGTAAQIARRDFAQGRKIAGVSESVSGAKEGEVREGIQEKQSTYVVKLSDGTSRTTRAYSESQARNAVEKPLKAVGSDLQITGIHIREKGESTGPLARRTGEAVIQTTRTTPIAKTEPVVETPTPKAEPVVETPSIPTEKPKYDPWKEAQKLIAETEEPAAPVTKQKTWTDPKYKHTWKVAEVKEGVAYLERMEDGRIRRRTISESALEEGKGKPPAPKGEVVTEGPSKIASSEKVLEPGEKPPTRPTKEQVRVPEKGIPDEVMEDSDFVSMMKDKGYEVNEGAYAGFTKKGVPVRASEVWNHWREYDRTGELIAQKTQSKAEADFEAELEAINQKITRQADRDVWDKAVKEAKDTRDYTKLVDKIEKEQGVEEAKRVRDLARQVQSEESARFKEEEKLRKAQTKEKFKKENYEVTFSNGRTVTVKARSEASAREYATSQAKKFKAGITVSAINKKASPIEAAVKGISKKVEESNILNSPVAKLLGTVKSIAFGGDIGHLLRQGKQMNADLLFSKHAKRTLEQLPVIFKAAKSQEFFDNFHKKLYEDPDIKMMVDDFGLDMPGIGEHLREEAFHGSPAENIPIIGRFYAKPSERAYTAGLNFLRDAEVKKFVGNLRKKGFTPENAPEKFRAVARGLNIISQRGDLSPAYQKLFSDASLVYGAPRAKAARVQNLIELARGGTSGDVVRLTAAKTLAFNATMLGLINASMGGEFITDSERSDFLKYKVNDKISIDPFVGLGVSLRTLAKMYHGHAYSPYSGKNIQTPWGKAIGDELLSGLAPGVRLMIEGIFGRDTRGFQVDRIKSLLNVAPLTARNITELLTAGETEDAFVLAMLQAGGEGVDVFDYEEAQEEQKRLKEERGISTGRRKKRKSPSW